jgi:hypothetical protein
MIFGLVVRPIVMIVSGIAVLAFIALEMLVGYRKIRWKGRMHLVWHKRIAWTLIAIAAVHGLLGILFATGLQIG